MKEIIVGSNEAGQRMTKLLKKYLKEASDGFLYKMVRILVGTLIKIGRGQIEPEAMAQMIAAEDREAAGPTAHPQGLYLMEVKYE